MPIAHLSPREREVADIHGSWAAAEKNIRLVDQTLVAITQLAVVQTNTQQAILSLVDGTYQHILAEATRSSSLADRASSSQNSQIPRGDVTYNHCLLEARLRCEDLPRDGLAVLDCSQDDQFRDHALVKRDGGIRFYAAVPMISEAGHHVGVLAVVDTAPRQELSQRDLENLRESAACAVRHLELVRTSIQCAGKSKLLRSIASSIGNQYPCLQLKEGIQQDGTLQNPKESIADPHQETYIPPAIDSPLQAERPPMQDQLTSAFRSVANALQESLLVDNIAIYGPVGFGRLAETKVKGEMFSEPHIPSNAAQISSVLLATSSHRDGSHAQQTPSVATIKSLTAKYPGGTSFRFTSDGTYQCSRSPKSVQSSDGLAQDLIDEQTIGNLHLLGLDCVAQDLIFLPVYHPQKRDLLAACFLWSTSGGHAAPLPNFVDLRAIGNCLSQHVAQIISNKTEVEFLSNFSHELRSPIHGVMGAAQFLQDTTSNSYQTGLIESILTCSNTLLDSLDLVLDHMKLGKGDHIPDLVQADSSDNAPSVASMFASEPVDLALLVEEATESVVAGHFFENPARDIDSCDHQDQNKKSIEDREGIPSNSHDVRVVLALAVDDNWTVTTQPGAIRRIILNLLGNSLKFTPHGSITVALERDPRSPDDDGSNLKFHIRVEDTGIGMSQMFQEESLFVPFRQENQFEPGVGLGLSIVHRIVKSLGGTIVVKSKPHQGTVVDIGLSLPVHQNDQAGLPQDIQDILSRVKGKHIACIDASKFGQKIEESIQRRETALNDVVSNWLNMRVSKTGNMDVEDADFYLYSEPPPPGDLLERHRETPDHKLSSGEIPLIVVATDSKEAHMIETNHAKALQESGRIVEVLAQPCGPRKLAKVLRTCLDRQAQSMRNRTGHNEKVPNEVPSSLAADPGTPSIATPPASESQSRSLMTALDSFDEPQPKSDEKARELPYRSSNIEPPRTGQDNSAEGENQDHYSSSHEPIMEDYDAEAHSKTAPKHTLPPTPVPDGRKPLHGLIVDDNRVNLRLLATLMKKSKYSYAEAENGQEAVDAFRACGNATDDGTNPTHFDFVLMDIGMPVMNGMEATKLIRGHEKEHNLQRTKIIALTAWADTKTREEALASGMDIFLPKPVKFPQLREILAKLYDSPE